MTWQREIHDSEWPFDLLGVRFDLDRGRTALVVIDMQNDYIRSAADSELARRCPELVSRLDDRVASVVLPNQMRLLESFRAAGRTVVFTRNGCMTSTGQEMSPRLRALMCPPKMFRGTEGYAIHQALAPRPEELVIDKLTSGAFTASTLDHALRNRGVSDLVLTGLFTDMCVFGTARTGAELGYNVLICEDACAAFSQRAHTEALLMHARRFGRVADTDDVLRELTPG